MHNNVINFPPVTAACGSCRWSSFCVIGCVDAEHRTQTAKSLACNGPLPRGTHIFRQGDTLKNLYIVKSGSVKCYLDSEDGCEQTVAFHFSGDLMGFDAVADGRHQTSAIPLETTAVCALPYQGLFQCAVQSPPLLHEFMRVSAAQLAEKQHHALLLGQKSAQARFANFLLSLSNRFAARGCSRSEFNLSMSRQEIANYLAVAVETISRLFSDFQRRGVLQVDRRFISIRSLTMLREVAAEGRALGVSNG